MKKDFLEKGYEIIKNVEGGIIFSLTKEEEEGLLKLIELDDYNEEHELRILRNFIVLAISKDCKDDYSNFKENRILLTALTSLIDNKLFRNGYPV